MKTLEIVELIKQTHPKLLGNLPEAKAARIISAAFAQIGKQLDEVSEGAVKVPPLGAFRVKHIEREKEGQKVTVKKISFRIAKPKVKKEEQATEE